MKVGEETIEVKVGDNYGGKSLTEDYAILELNADGSATMVLVDNSDKGKGTWKPAKEKNTIVVTIAGDPMTMSCDGKTVEIEMEGITLMLVSNEKADDSTGSDSESKEESEEKNMYTGRYKFQLLRTESEGKPIEVKVGESYGGITFKEDFIILELKEDDSATFTVSGNSTTGTWTPPEKNTIVVTIEGDSMTMKCDGKTVEIESEGVVIVLVSSGSDPEENDPNENDPDAYAGTYRFQSMIVESESASTELKIGDVSEGITLSEKYVKLQLNEDGSAVLSVQDIFDLNGTWAEADEKDTIVLTLAGEEQTISCDKTNLKMKFDEGLWFVLKK